jgi:hypothetical protein
MNEREKETGDDRKREKTKRGEKDKIESEIEPRR